jgi:hypothetical protein
MLGGVAFAEGDAAWDGTYAREAAGGNEKCPDADSVTVTKGSFSIAWDVRYEAKMLRVGKIDATIGTSGTVKVSAAVFSPLAAQTVAALQEMSHTVDDLNRVATEMKIRVQAKGTRTISLDSGFCYARWVGAEVMASDDDADDAAAAPPAAPLAKAMTKKTKLPAKPASKKTVKAAAPTKPKPAAVAATAKPAPAPTPKPAAAPAPVAAVPKAAPTTKKSSRSSKSARSSDTTKPAEKPAPPPEPKKLGNGAKCWGGSDCESTYCERGYCQKFGASGMGRADGEKCGSDYDCASRNCSYNKCAQDD